MVLRDFGPSRDRRVAQAHGLSHFSSGGIAEYRESTQRSDGEAVGEVAGQERPQEELRMTKGPQLSELIEGTAPGFRGFLRRSFSSHLGLSEGPATVSQEADEQEANEGAEDIFIYPPYFPERWVSPCGEPNSGGRRARSPAIAGSCA